jgi:hypothetical protein
MDTLKLVQGLIAARDGLIEAYKHQGFANHEIANDDLPLPKVEAALNVLRESTEHFEDVYDITEREIDNDRAQKLGAAADRHLWTVVEGDAGTLYVTAGWAYVNRMEYLLTKQPWHSADETWLWAEFSDSDDGEAEEEDDAEQVVLPSTDHEALWRRTGLDRRIDADALTVSFMDILCEEINGGATPSDVRDRVEARLDRLLEFIPEDFRGEVFKVLSEAGYRPPAHRS